MAAWWMTKHATTIHRIWVDVAMVSNRGLVVVGIDNYRCENEIQIVVVKFPPYEQ